MVSGRPRVRVVASGGAGPSGQGADVVAGVVVVLVLRGTSESVAPVTRLRRTVRRCSRSACSRFCIRGGQRVGRGFGQGVGMRDGVQGLFLAFFLD